MALGEITTTDLNRWQFRGAEVLADLIKAGLKAERHPLTWTLTSNGALRGEVTRFDGLSETDRRAVFDEWVSVLGADQPRESKGYPGNARLTAVFSHPTNRGDVQGSVVLDLDVEDDDV